MYRATRAGSAPRPARRPRRPRDKSLRRPWTEIDYFDLQSIILGGCAVVNCANLERLPSASAGCCHFGILLTAPTNVWPHLRVDCLCGGLSRKSKRRLTATATQRRGPWALCCCEAPLCPCLTSIASLCIVIKYCSSEFQIGKMSFRLGCTPVGLYDVMFMNGSL